MSRDKVVATVRDGLLTESATALLPLFLKRTGDVAGWLADRAIDSRRTNSRLLKKALRLTTADDIEVVLKVNTATITDTYWFRQEGSGLKYEDVRFRVNYFDKLALRGDPDSFNQPYSPTPELTNNVALFARGIPENLERSNDRLISLFCDLLELDDQALEIVKKFQVPECEMINTCAEKIAIRIDRETLCSYIMNGSGHIQDRIHKHLQ